MTINPVGKKTTVPAQSANLQDLLKKTLGEQRLQGVLEKAELINPSNWTKKDNSQKKPQRSQSELPVLNKAKERDPSSKIPKRKRSQSELPPITSSSFQIKKSRSNSDVNLGGVVDPLTEDSSKRLNNCGSILNEIQEKQLHKSKIVNDILSQFPELQAELENPTETLNALLDYIFQLQSSDKYLEKNHWSKTESGKIFTVDILSKDEAYIEITRTAEDKGKHGGESKFNRIICLKNEQVERCVGLKIRFNANDRENEIKIRLGKINDLKNHGLDDKLILVSPKATIEYTGKVNQQLLSVYEYLGNHILSSAAKEKWDFKKTIHAACLAAKALVEFHSKGLLHRDIKPQNILGYTNQNGELVVKIADLGFVIKQQDAAQNDFAGSIEYISLENYLNVINSIKVCNSEAIDRYAFGKTILKMLERIDNHDTIYAQGEQILQSSFDSKLKEDIENQKQGCDQIHQFMKWLETVMQLNGSLSSVQDPSAKHEIFQKLYKSISDLKLMLDKQQCLKLDQKEISRRLDILLHRLASLDIKDILLLDGLLRNIYRDLRAQFDAGQTVYFGLVLDASPDFKASPQGKAYQLIYDLMTDGRINSTKEVEQRLLDIHQ